MQGLQIGRIVHVVAKDGATVEPGVVLKVYGVSDTIPDGTIDCKVWGIAGDRAGRSVKYDPNHGRGTWDWPPRDAQ